MQHRRGITDGAHVTLLHPEMLQVERWGTLTHELIHVERGHTGVVTAGEAQAVRDETVRRLIPLEQLLDALVWAHSWEEAADALWGTLDVFTDRLEHLSALERAAVAALKRTIEGTA